VSAYSWRFTQQQRLLLGAKTEEEPVKQIPLFLVLVAACSLTAAPVAVAQDQKPNILVIWGDDIGMWNISAYHRGMMGGSTPDIDRIAREGMMFMDHYAQAGKGIARFVESFEEYPPSQKGMSVQVTNLSETINSMPGSR
jgi:hypothetical protein